jgi:thiol-disulfide isomerase/thioredoxin
VKDNHDNLPKESAMVALTPDQPSGDPPHHVNDYRFEHLNLGLLLRDMRFRRTALVPGERLPDATLVDLDGQEVSLPALAAGRPIALVTGSTTCPATASAMPDLKRLEQHYGDRVQFVLLQVREAHPGAEVDQPHTLRDKIQHAQLMREVYDVGWPVLVDDIDGTLHRQLDTEPNSLHIIAADGEIIYRALFAGAAGVENAIAAVAAGEQPTKKTSQSLLPVLNSVGFMHDTVVGAGAGAYSDMLKAAPHMVAVALGAKLLPFIPKKKRGLVLMIASIGIVVVLAVLVS